MRHVLEKVLIHPTPLCQSSLLSPIQVFSLHPDPDVPNGDAEEWLWGQE